MLSPSVLFNHDASKSDTYGGAFHLHHQTPACTVAGEEEDVDLTEQPVKWILPPSVVYNSDTAEVETPRLMRQEAAHFSSAKPRRQPSAKRHATVSLPSNAMS